MKFFKQGTVIITLLLMTYLYAPDFPSVQVNKVWILTDNDLAAIKNTKIGNTVYEYPNFLDYVEKNAPPFGYLLGGKLQERGDFDTLQPEKLFNWLDDAMGAIKKESFMQTTPLAQQKSIGVEIMSTVTKKLLEKYCTTNEILQNDTNRLQIIRGNAPIQIDTYLSIRWVEDWLAQAREKMVWTQLPNVFETTGNNIDMVFTIQTDPYTINMEWLCNALKSAHADIKSQENSTDRDLAAYCTSDPKKRPHALIDAEKMIVDKAIELITPKLPTEGKTKEEITETIQQITRGIQNALTQCVYQTNWFGPEYTQKWVHLDKYLQENKVSTKTVDGKKIGILTDKWLKDAIAEAKKDRDAENINDETVVREAIKKIENVIPLIQGIDYRKISDSVQNKLKQGWLKMF